MSDITPTIESQMVRVMEALDRALIHAAQRSQAEGAQPGLAADYARRHPAATVADIVAAIGCSKTTARQARQAWPSATICQRPCLLHSGWRSRGRTGNFSEKKNGNDVSDRL